MASKKNSDTKNTPVVKEEVKVETKVVKEPVTEDLPKAVYSDVLAESTEPKEKVGKLLIIKDTPFRSSTTPNSKDIVGTAKAGNKLPIINIVSNMSGKYYLVNGHRYVKDCEDVKEI